MDHLVTMTARAFRWRAWGYVLGLGLGALALAAWVIASVALLIALIQGGGSGNYR